MAARTPSAPRLRRCLERVRLPPARLDNALARVRHMDFAPDELVRFGPRDFAAWHSESWFPTGFRSYETVVEHELRPFQSTGISRAMLDDARRCCDHCERYTIARGNLTVGHRRRGKMEATTQLIRRLHAKQPLPEHLEIYASDHDIYRPPSGMGARCERAGGVANLRPPILVHARRATDRGLLARPESTFFQSYGRNVASWDVARTKLLEAGRAAAWADRATRIFFRGSGSGYRKFLNYSETGRLDLHGTDVWHSSPPQCDSAGRIIRRHIATNGKPLSRAATPPAARRCTPFVNTSSACSSKYLLHLAGTWPGHSNRLKWLMACGSTIVMPQNDWYEWWHLLLEPFETFLPTANVALGNGRDLPAARECLVAHDAEARRVGEAARRFVQDVLTEELQERYMRALLTRYAALQRH
eukprot:7379035-Prymnesium_polylepis.1